MAKGLLNPSEASRYPNLRQVLNERARELTSLTTTRPSLVASVSLFVFALLAALSTLMPLWVLVSMMGLCLIAGFRLLHARKNAENPERTARLAQLEIVKRMITCLENNRLEHDISPSNAALLEGCAVAYLHAWGALDAWKPSYTPEVKWRISNGVNEAMDEAIRAHQDLLPQNPNPLPMGVQIGKAADQFLFGKGANTSAPIEPAFGKTRAIVDQLRDAAHTVEDASREPLDSAQPPLRSPSLQDALSDLKMMKQAEEELREDLHGGA